MTQHFFSRQLRFFMTASAPCPYLPGQFERKVFANLPFSDGADVNDALTQAGFRRSQNIAYRPACEACAACVSVSALNKVDLPTLGSPTIPHLKPMICPFARQRP